MHLQSYPEIVLPLSLQFPIQMNETFECKGVCSPSTGGQSFGKCLGLEGAGVNSGQAKTKRACIPLHSCLASLNRDLSAVKTILFCWQVLPFPTVIFYGACLLLHLWGRGPTEPANLRAGSAEAVWGPTMLEEEGVCATTAEGFWMRAPKASSRRLLAIETGTESLAINKYTAFIYCDCKGLCLKGCSLFSSIIMYDE